MSLFSNEPINLLPCDGEVLYFGQVINPQQANHYFSRLMETIAWKNDEAIVFGKRIVTKRKVAWYGDVAFDYTYSSITRQALPWTDELLQLKQLAQTHTATTYNSCLLNLYHDGNEGMSWHSDNEKELKHHGAIASISFGAERKFSFKHQQLNHTTSVILQHGSLLVMQGATQTHWLHSLPKTTKITKPRISLTFRSMATQQVV